MKGLISLLLGAVILAVGVSARGRVFQRFSPEILANLGYGGGHMGMYREVRWEWDEGSEFLSPNN